MSLVRAQQWEPKNSKSTDLEFFYPSRRLGISSDASRYIIKGDFPPLHLITHQRASSCGLMIYKAFRFGDMQFLAELMIYTPTAWFVKLLFCTMSPNNPECESVQDFYFLRICLQMLFTSSLFTIIRIQDFFICVRRTQHHLTEGQHHFRAKSCFATSREHHFSFKRTQNDVVLRANEVAASRKWCGLTPNDVALCANGSNFTFGIAEYFTWNNNAFMLWLCWGRRWLYGRYLFIG